MHYNPSTAKLIKLLSVIIFSIIIFDLTVFSQQKKLVESVDIQGNRRYRDETLLKGIKIRPGDVFDEKQIQADFQSLLKMNIFHTERNKVFTETGRRGGINVIFKVFELPLISEISIEGISDSDKTQIYRIFKESLNLEAGKPYMPNKMRIAKEIIEKYLAEQYYSVTRINIGEEEISALSVRISFEIEAKREPQFIKIIF